MLLSSISFPVGTGVHTNPWSKDLFRVLGASILISLSSYISIPLYFTPVPLVIQSHVILLIAAILGSKRAFLATLAFLIQGSFGLPVFSSGNSGLLYMMGPTGGYLIGYLVAAFATGYIFERMKERTAIKTLASFAMGNLIIYILGAAWLSSYIGLKPSVCLGILPFLLGDTIKNLFISRALKSF
ncbi:MAG: biotin transporter BioY [Chlamydiae bacterium]|nr:biotin transporter BioY [Chlamydiota bacterium]